MDFAVMSQKHIKRRQHNQFKMLICLSGVEQIINPHTNMSHDASYIKGQD